MFGHYYAGYAYSYGCLSEELQIGKIDISYVHFSPKGKEMEQSTLVFGVSFNIWCMIIEFG